jgi:hypothetical protein
VEEGMWDGQIRILDLEPENAWMSHSWSDEEEEGGMNLRKLYSLPIHVKQ